jgi:predicted kinase
MPKLIIINGSMGSGKSTISKLLSQKLSDINYNLKLDDLVWNFSNSSDQSIDMTKAIFSIANSITEKCLLMGVSVIVEKVMNIEQLKEFVLIGERFNIKPFQIILSLPLETAIERVKLRRKQDGKICDAEYLNRVKQSHVCTEQLINLYTNQCIIPVEIYTPEQICIKILEEIKLN